MDISSIISLPVPVYAVEQIICYLNHHPLVIIKLKDLPFKEMDLKIGLEILSFIRTLYLFFQAIGLYG